MLGKILHVFSYSSVRSGLGQQLLPLLCTNEVPGSMCILFSVHTRFLRFFFGYSNLPPASKLIKERSWTPMEINFIKRLSWVIHGYQPKKIFLSIFFGLRIFSMDIFTMLIFFILTLFCRLLKSINAVQVRIFSILCQFYWVKKKIDWFRQMTISQLLDV